MICDRISPEKKQQQQQKLKTGNQLKVAYKQQNKSLINSIIDEKIPVLLLYNIVMYALCFGRLVSIKLNIFNLNSDCSGTFLCKFISQHIFCFRYFMNVWRKKKEDKKKDISYINRQNLCDTKTVELSEY